VCSAAVRVLTVLDGNHCKRKHCKAVHLQHQVLSHILFGIRAFMSACTPCLYTLRCRAACFVHHSDGLISHLSKQRLCCIIGTPGLSCKTHLQDVWCMRLNLLRCCVQVDEAYLQFGPAHDIVGFMQSLGYKDFRTARQGEEKMEQFKRALKLTRPAFAATRSPMQQVPTWLAHHTVACLLAAKHGSPCL
jgi:hypothetical protein